MAKLTDDQISEVFDELGKLDQEIKELKNKIDSLSEDELGEDFDTLDRQLSQELATLQDERKAFLRRYEDDYNLDFDV